METTAKSEEQFIADIKKSIEDTSLKVSDKVIKSAYAYLLKNECIHPAKAEVAKGFFVKNGKLIAVIKINKACKTEDIIILLFKLSTFV